MFTHRWKLDKPIKNPADYDGTQSLPDYMYLKHFEHYSGVNGWNQEEAALFLAESLRGVAQKLLNGMSDKAYSGTLTRREIVRANASLGEIRKN